MGDQYPSVPVRDRVTPLVQLVDWLERAGVEDIWLIDNASTFEPLLDYLRSTPHHVVRSEQNSPIVRRGSPGPAAPRPEPLLSS
ncbi:MAG: hypothetical protein R2715_10310 [Ilumatobacteraceae bacterium]